MRPRLATLALAAALAAALGYWLVREAQAQAGLRARQAALSAKAEQLARLLDNNRRLAADSARLNAEKRSQADRVRDLAARIASAEGRLPPGFKPVGDWRNAGLATPEDAYETYIWAIDRADLDALAGVLAVSPKERGRIAAAFNALPDETRAEYGTPDRMFALLYANRYPVWFEATEVTRNDVKYGSFATVTTERQYAGGQIREHDFLAWHTAEGWKTAVSDAEVEYTLQSELGTAPSP